MWNETLFLRDHKTVTRVIVTGSRDWPTPDDVEEALDEVLLSTKWLTLVHGACPTGADLQANEWAKQKILKGAPVEIEPHPALWNLYGKSAGYRRNAEMVSQNANLCLAFIHNDSDGASHTESLAKNADIPTKTYRSYSVPSANNKNVEIENAHIVFRNFEGREGTYNDAGERGFSVVLDDETADAMAKDGWNVKRKPPREEGDENFNHIPIKVSFKFRPPRIVLITTVKGKPKRTNLDEDTCMLLDFADLKTVDLIIRPSSWTFNGKSGVKAYLHAIYATVNQDKFELKYEDVPELEAPSEQLAIEQGYIDGEAIEDSEEYE